MTDQDKRAAKIAVMYHLMFVGQARVVEPVKPRIDPKLGTITQGYAFNSLTDSARARKRNKK